MPCLTKRFVSVLCRYVSPIALGIALGSATLPSSAWADDSAFDPAKRAQLLSEIAQEARLLEQQTSLLKKIAKAVSPTVVHIDAAKSNESSNRRRRVEEAGSGVILQVNDQFYVLTNRHVVKSAMMNNIKIRLADGRTLYPTKMWADPGTDVAILALDAQNLIPAQLGNSDQVEIGDFVIAVGSPFGLSHSVTYGIISAKGRRDLELGDEGVKFQDFMQTDAAINPGNSGGPLINLRGEVIGLNTAIASSSGGSEGIGFTIPINMAMIIAKQLIERGEVVRAFLGVTLADKFDPETAIEMGLSRPGGARVTAVIPGAPGEISGLRENDVILLFNGTRVDNGSHLINLVSLTETDASVPIRIFRHGELLDLMVKVGNRSDFERPPTIEASVPALP